jgi:hypothetical protein
MRCITPCNASLTRLRNKARSREQSCLSFSSLLALPGAIRKPSKRAGSASPSAQGGWLHPGEGRRNPSL